MNFREYQKGFDRVKWYDSILEGEDRCGTYEFCENCKKSEKYPCARAANRYEKQNKGFVRIAVIRRHG